MSAKKRRLEAKRWLFQARDDLEAGLLLLQAAFLAQQAGEKAPRGLWIALDLWGHSPPEEARALLEAVEVRLGAG